MEASFAISRGCEPWSTGSMMEKPRSAMVSSSRMVSASRRASSLPPQRANRNTPSAIHTRVAVHAIGLARNRSIAKKPCARIARIGISGTHGTRNGLSKSGSVLRRRISETLVSRKSMRKVSDAPLATSATGNETAMMIISTPLIMIAM